MEPAYVDAVLAYDKKDYNQALRIIEGLLAQQPDVTEFLELKALLLKTRDDAEHSAEVYRKLIALAKAANRPEREIAAYHYELGLLLYRKGDFEGARRELQPALAANFNPAASHFFLGLADLRENKLDSAREHFSATAASDSATLRPVANLYLAQIASKQGNASSSIQRYFEARKLSKSAIDDAKSDADTRRVSQQVYDAASQALKPYDRSSWFGNVGFTFGYDSNAISTPGTSASGLGSTAKATLQGGVGYATSALNTYQFIPSYRGAYNFNFEGDKTLQGEFFSNDFSLYVTRNALARTSWGFKVEPIYSFQDQPNVDASGKSSRHYSGYSLVMPLGPYVRHELRPNWVLTGELFVSWEDYLTDNASSNPTLQRSGFDYNLRVTVRNDRGARYWNPSVALVFDKNATHGSEFSSQGAMLELGDVMRPLEKLFVTATIDLGLASFPDAANADASVSGRSDKPLLFDVNASYRIGPRYSLLADVSYTDNISNDAVYQFTRAVVSAGVSYAF